MQTGASSLRMIGVLTIKDQTKPAALEIDLTCITARPLAGFIDYKVATGWPLKPRASFCVAVMALARLPQVLRTGRI